MRRILRHRLRYAGKAALGALRWLGAMRGGPRGA
jgi:hypothetical protein